MGFGRNRAPWIPRDKTPWMMYADDIVLVDESRLELECRINLLKHTLEIIGLKLNVVKTEYMACESLDSSTIQIALEPADKLEKCVLRESGSINQDVQARIIIRIRKYLLLGTSGGRSHVWSVTVEYRSSSRKRYTRASSNRSFYTGAGVRCETQCEAGRFGEQCSERCPCANNSSCDADSGRCVCAAGWRGERCDTPCAPGTYGVACKQRCPPHTHGNVTCDPVSGQSTCPSGYTGMNCEYPCPLGTYGEGCQQRCNCKNGADCHHVTGACLCLPGWRGAQCGAKCAEGWWGADCSQPCRCARGAACRPNDGYCRCPPGYTGSYCTQFCPEGYFGDHCMEACNCSSEGNWVCDPVKGCVCQRGYIGDRCDIHASDAIIIDRANTGSSAGLTAVLVVLVCACVAGAALLLLYYRKRLRNLKREIAHVHYTADPGSQPEQQHFDNPVYSFQGSTRGDDSATLLNNSTHIFNNLGTGSKLNNATLERLRMTATSSNGNYDPMSSLKNKDADLTNPNLYHCIDDENKLDHVYDEIKHKEGYEMEYDHLNYTPPANTWKPHYQRMNNGIAGSALDAVSSAATPMPTVAPTPTAAATPPIPPLPKLHMAPAPDSELEPLAVPPPPPLRDDPPSDVTPTP
ncbi:unnamed protein product [Euphydryas editha]|uniref:EGF-like domain-containing protein n=1 Tax=Euphydryas editha TaxID=104508 RepID=A0AAU9V2A4_EUPED|nr:unnamed protein product [Euphydryas editha]